MTKKRPYIGPSEAQSKANAERLEMRGRPYSTTHAASVEAAWDYTVRTPNDLRGLVRAARRAYEDEVPTKLHEGPDNIGEGGTPKMAAQAEGYIFGRPDADDAERAKCLCRKTYTTAAGAPHDETRAHAIDCPRAASRPILSYHLTPFRATLDRMEKGGNERAMRAAIVSAITIGGQEPFDAVTSVAQRYPQTFARVFARLVAEDALRVFFNAYSDVKVDTRPEAAA